MSSSTKETIQNLTIRFARLLAGLGRPEILIARPNPLLPSWIPLLAPRRFYCDDPALAARPFAKQHCKQAAMCMRRRNNPSAKSSDYEERRSSNPLVPNSHHRGGLLNPGNYKVRRLFTHAYSSPPIWNGVQRSFHMRGSI